MSDRRFSFDSPLVKLGAYAAVLGLALGGGTLVGATLGPDPSADTGGHDAGHATTEVTAPGGLSASQDGDTRDGPDGECSEPDSHGLSP